MKFNFLLLLTLSTSALFANSSDFTILNTQGKVCFDGVTTTEICETTIPSTYEFGFETGAEDSLFFRTKPEGYPNNDHAWRQLPSTYAGNDTIRPAEGDYALFYKPTCCWRTNQTATLQSRPMNLTGKLAATLSFSLLSMNHVGTINNFASYNSLQIEVKSDHTPAWIKIWDSKDHALPNAGRNSEWRNVSIDLQRHISSSTSIRFIGSYLYSEFDLGGQLGLDRIKIETESASNDTQAPSAPTNLYVSDRTQDTFRINWSPSTDNSGNVKYAVYEHATTDNAYNTIYLGTFDTHYADITPSLNKAGSDALLKVEAIGPSGKVSDSAFISGNTLYPPEMIDSNGYCAPSTNQFDSFSRSYIIGSVLRFWDFVNTSGPEASSYSDFSDKTITVYRGESSSFYVNIERSYYLDLLLNLNPDSLPPKAILKVFVDYDQNKYISTMSEKELGFYERAAYENNIEVLGSDKLVLLTLDIPESAKLGNTKMRIILDSDRSGPDTHLDFCRNTSKYHGEIEDYTLNIMDR